MSYVLIREPSVDKTAIAIENYWSDTPKPFGAIFQDEISMWSELAGSHRSNQKPTNVIQLSSFAETLADYPATNEYMFWKTVPTHEPSVNKIALAIGKYKSETPKALVTLRAGSHI